MSSDELWPRDAEHRFRLYSQRDGELEVLAAAPTPEAVGVAIATLHADAKEAGRGFPTSGTFGLLDAVEGHWIINPFPRQMAAPKLALAPEPAEPRTVFPTLEAFYADRPERDSVQHDFGMTWWSGGDSFPKYRVSWIPATGEVYCYNLGGVHHPHGGQVEILGTVEGRERVEAALGGWADLEPHARQLRWVTERIA